MKVVGSLVTFEGAGLDVDLSLDVNQDRVGNAAANTLRQHLVTSGMMGSTLESEVLNLCLQRDPGAPESVSAARLIEEAALRGIPIHTITPANRATAMADLVLPSAVLADIHRSVDAGLYVTVPRTQMTLDGGPEYGTYTGVGYVILNPETGASSYMILGGLGGGADWGEAGRRLDMLMNGDFAGFLNAAGNGMRDWARNQGHVMFGDLYGNFIITLLLAGPIGVVLTAYGIGGITAFFLGIVIGLLISELVAWAGRGFQ